MQWDITPTQIPSILLKIKNMGRAYIPHGNNVINLTTPMVSTSYNALGTIHLVDTATAIETNRSVWHGGGGNSSIEFKTGVGAATPAFTEVSAITLNAGENILAAAAIDVASGFAYFACQTSPSKIVKVNLNTFTETATLTLNVNENNVSAMVISGGFLYAATNGSPIIVVKIDLSTFTRVTAITLNSGENGATAAVVDGIHNFLYIGCDVDPPIIVKIDLSTFTRTASTSPGGNLLEFGGGAIDSVNGKGYFPVFGPFNSFVMRLDIPSFTVDSLVGVAATRVPRGSAIDTGNQRFYACQDNSIVQRVDTSTFTSIGNTGYTGSSAAGNPVGVSIDTTNQFLYVSTQDTPAIVDKIDLAAFAQVATITLNAGENDGRCSVIDTTNNFLYIGTATSPGKVVKITTTAIASTGSQGRLLVRLTGGYSYTCDGSSSNVNDQYDDFVNANTALAGAPLNGFAATAFGINGYEYSIDGFNGATSNLNSRFDRSANAWSTKQTTLAASSDLASFTINGLGFKTCGFNAAHNAVTGATERYNPSSNAAWTARTAATTARRDLAAFTLAGLGFAVGGSANGTTALSPSPNERFDDTANAWTARTAMTTALWVTSGSSLDGFGITFEGTPSNAAANVVTTQQFDDVTNSWAFLGTGGAVALSQVSACHVGGYAIINGGVDTTNTSVSTRYRFDRIAGTYTSKAALSAANALTSSCNYVETWIDYMTMEP